MTKRKYNPHKLNSHGGRWLQTIRQNKELGNSKRIKYKRPKQQN